MEVSTDMAAMQAQIEDVISGLAKVFTSHHFINVFTQRHQRVYVNWLNNTAGDNPFQQVHAEMAKHLSENSTKYNIEATRKVGSLNIFGQKSTGIQEWRKL